MNKDLELLGLKIKEIRISKKLSQEKLAHKCDFDRTYISMLVKRGQKKGQKNNVLH